MAFGMSSFSPIDADNTVISQCCNATVVERSWLAFFIVLTCFQHFLRGRNQSAGHRCGCESDMVGATEVGRGRLVMDGFQIVGF